MKSISARRSALSLLIILTLTTGSYAQHIILPANSESQAINQTATSPAGEAQTLPLPKTDSPKSTLGTTVLQTAAESHHGNFFTHLLREQETIWTSPFRLKKGDAKWLVPLALTTAALIATDRDANDKFTKRHGVLETSSQVSRLGEAYTTFAFAGLAYTLGRFNHNERLRETGRIGFEALINTSLAVGGLKYVLARKRPAASEERGNFFSGGQSFPSGHAATVWALASVVAEEYADKPWVRFGAYGLATAISMSRFTGQKHFPSDVFIGSAIGYLIGRFTVKAHASKRKNKVVTMVSPTISQTTRSYGLSATVSF